MKAFQFVPVLLVLALLQGCGAGEDDSEPASNHNPTPVSSSSSAPAGKEQIQALVSYEPNLKTEKVILQQRKEGQPEFESDHPIILSSKIPDTLTLKFPAKKEWMSGNVVVSTRFGEEVREIHGEMLPTGQDGGDLKIQGLRNLFPDGLGLMGAIEVRFGSNGAKQTLTVQVGTPPAVPIPELLQVESGQIHPIQISSSLSVVPLVRIGISNTSLNQWGLAVPYRPNVQWMQKIKKVSYNPVECAVQTQVAESDEVAASQFLLIRSGIVPTQFPKLPLNDLAQADAFTINPQERSELTLYALLGPTHEMPLFAGRKSSDVPRELSPGCQDGSCMLREAYYDRLTLVRSCKLGETLIAEGWACRTVVQGNCPRAGACDFGPDMPGLFTLGPCLQRYKEPLPTIPFANYSDVLQSRLLLSKLFSNAHVHYSESAFSTPEQASHVPVSIDQIVLH